MTNAGKETIKWVLSRHQFLCAPPTHHSQLLSGHPHIASLVETLEDEVAVHLILELAEGGELLQCVGAPGAPPPTEAFVARHVRAMARFLAHAHALGILHRDVKLENFLLSSADLGTATIKAADFGLSTFLRPGERSVRGVVGSAYYMAPEVLVGPYGTAADIWSLGVVLHILLSGLAPFPGDTEVEVWTAAARARLRFSEEPWTRVSAPARRLVRAMLSRDPSKRPTAAQIARHPWVNGGAPDLPLGQAVHDRLREFATLSRVRQVAMLVAEEELSKVWYGGGVGGRERGGPWYWCLYCLTCILCCVVTSQSVFDVHCPTCSQTSITPPTPCVCAAGRHAGAARALLLNARGRGRGGTGARRAPAQRAVPCQRRPADPGHDLRGPAAARPRHDPGRGRDPGVLDRLAARRAAGEAGCPLARLCRRAPRLVGARAPHLYPQFLREDGRRGPRLHQSR